MPRVIPSYPKGYQFFAPQWVNYRGKVYYRLEYPPMTDKGIASAKATRNRESGQQTIVKTFTATFTKNPKRKKKFYLLYGRRIVPSKRRKK